MLEPNLADRTKGDVSNGDTGFSLAFNYPSDSPHGEQRDSLGPPGNSRKEGGGKAAASCFAGAGRCLPEVVTVHEHL